MYSLDSRFGAGTRRREAQTLRNRQDSTQEGAQHQGSYDSSRGRLEEHFPAPGVVGQGVPEGQHLQEAVARTGGHVAAERDASTPIPEGIGSS